jgi:hypothetical protein
MEMFKCARKNGAEVLFDRFTTEFEPAERGKMSVRAIGEGVYVVNFWVKIKA